MIQLVIRTKPTTNNSTINNKEKEDNVLYGNVIPSDIDRTVYDDEM